MKAPCTTCSGTGQVHSHNPNCWDCFSLGYTINGVIWRPPLGSNEYVDKAFKHWHLTGELLASEPAS